MDKKLGVFGGVKRLEGFVVSVFSLAVAFQFLQLWLSLFEQERFRFEFTSHCGVACDYECSIFITGGAFPSFGVFQISSGRTSPERQLCPLFHRFRKVQILIFRFYRTIFRLNYGNLIIFWHLYLRYRRIGVALVEYRANRVSHKACTAALSCKIRRFGTDADTT